MLTSRERVKLTLDHKEADRIPLDLGASPVTGMHVSSVYILRQALGLDPPGTPVKVIEVYQMLGEIAPDLMAALGVDVVGLEGSKTFFGFEKKGWKSWRLFDGTPVLVPEGFSTDTDENGDVLLYPEGDKSVPPSGRMPAGGFYFDAIVRQAPIDDDELTPEDNLEEFTSVTDQQLEFFRETADWICARTDKAILANFGGTGFGDIALVPAVQLKKPRGIRDIEEWYISTLTRREYVYRVFERQCEIGLENLRRIHSFLGDKVDILFVTGTDFGTQAGPFISPRAYRDLYKPFHTEINNWVHRNTGWKTFIHSCGSVMALIPDFIDAGFDILNPVQCSAAEMDPIGLKARFGGRITFWGGGVDTQRTLPFGTPAQVRDQVRERILTFGANGGFVFNTIHNVQAGVPRENLVALYEAFRDFAVYPLG